MLTGDPCAWGFGGMPWDSTPVSGEGSSSGQKQQLGCDASETKALPGPMGARAGLTLHSWLGFKQGDWASGLHVHNHCKWAAQEEGNNLRRGNFLQPREGLGRESAVSCQQSTPSEVGKRVAVSWREDLGGSHNSRQEILLLTIH